MYIYSLSHKAGRRRVLRAKVLWRTHRAPYSVPTLYLKFYDVS